MEEQLQTELRSERLTELKLCPEEAEGESAHPTLYSCPLRQGKWLSVLPGLLHSTLSSTRGPVTPIPHKPGSNYSGSIPLPTLGLGPSVQRPQTQPGASSSCVFHIL